MAGTRYKFNPESLSFDKVRLGLKAVLLRMLAYFVGSLLVAFVYLLIFSAIIDSPKEKALKREIEQLTIQYELINREMDNVDKILKHLKETDDNLYRSIFEADPIPESYREAGYGGVSRYKELDGYDNSELVVETTRRLDLIKKKLVVQSRSFDELIDLSKNKEEMLRSLPAIQPISNKDLTRTASGFGLRVHPIYKIVKLHTGMDFTAPLGTDVFVTGDGVVESVVQDKRGYGNHIIVDHGFGYKTLYAHLDRFNVRRGQKVRRGDVIAFVGSTGASLAPHLHYEVILNGEKIDPVNFYYNDLTPAEYTKIVELAARTGQSFD